MADAPPHILLIVCHDLGRYLGCYGRAAVRTPHLDHLASEGVLCTNHFCTAPSCSPSRGSLMTGRYPHTNGLMGLVNLGWDLPATERTLPQYLNDRGYHTVLCGVQHERRRGAALSYARTLPIAGQRQAPEQAAAVAAFLSDRPAGPLFLSVGTGETHRPFPLAAGDNAAGPDLALPFLPDHPIVRQQMAGFALLVARLDQAVGLLLGALAHHGMAQDTLVIFTTDHGLDMPRAKGTLYDPGIETALLLRWPGHLPAGRQCDELLSGVDLLPTVLEAVSAPVPTCIQGRSYWPLLQDRAYQPRAEVYAEKTHHVDYDPMRCLRTARFKYIDNFSWGRHLEIPADVEMDCVTAVPELCRWRRPVAELYDLAADPFEQRNLAGQAEHAALTAELKGRLRQWQRDTGDPLLASALPLPPPP